jgi:hypothetical protein
VHHRTARFASVQVLPQQRCLTLAVLASGRSRGFDWRRSIMSADVSAQCGCHPFTPDERCGGVTLGIRRIAQLEKNKKLTGQTMF